MNQFLPRKSNKQCVRYFIMFQKIKKCWHIEELKYSIMRKFMLES